MEGRSPPSLLEPVFFTPDHLPLVHLGFPVSLRGTATLSNGIMIGLSGKGKGKIRDLACISPMGPGIII